MLIMKIQLTCADYTEHYISLWPSVCLCLSPDLHAFCLAVFGLSFVYFLPVKENTPMLDFKSLMASALCQTLGSHNVLDLKIWLH